MFGPERGCLALMWPLAMHLGNKNELLAWDLSQDPSELASLNAAQIQQRLFTRSADLPEGVLRLPIKSVHINKSPMVMGNLKVLSEPMAQRWGINVAAQLDNAVKARDLPDMSTIWAEVFKRDGGALVDVDEDLYGGFIGNADRRRLNDLRQSSPEQLAKARPAFDDARLTELLWRYRARNFPANLSAEEATAWEAHRAARLLEGEGGALTMTALFDELDKLAETADERGEAVLGALYDYAEMIAPQGD
jgi:exodeoxyribonuclease-1